MAEGSRRVGHTVHRMCNIVDMRGASMRLASRKCIEVFKAIAAVDQDNYPETMGSTYVVNAPWVFTAIWRVIRVFLDEGVTAKVHILGEGEPSRRALLEAVDADTLPAFLGGNCKCPGGCVSGPLCTSPDGLVASQRALHAFCEEFSTALRRGELGEDCMPIATPGTHAELPVTGLAAAAPAGPPKRRLTRSLGFRKPQGEKMIDPYPVWVPDASIAAEAAAEARRAAELAAAARLEAARAAAEREEAERVLAAAEAEAAVARAQVTSAEYAARSAAEEARRAARMAAAAAKALAARAGRVAAGALHRLTPTREEVFEDALDELLDETEVGG